MAEGRLPGVQDGWCRGTVIDGGTLALCVTPAPGSSVRGVATWTIAERLAEVIRRAAARLPGEAGDKLLALVSPMALASMALVLGAWAASHAVGIGEAADLLLIAGGVIFIGREAVDAAMHLGGFVSATFGASSEADLDRAASHLSSMVAIVGIDAALVLLTRGAVRANRSRFRPSARADPTRPAGTGGTDKYGNYWYSSAGSVQDQALARYHEMMHSILSPKWRPLRELRAEAGARGYQHSALLRYLEEALAEGFAQLRVNGIKGLPQALRFPIANGYVTVTALATEAAVGTVVAGGITWYVLVEAGEGAGP
jgi:hypothetical protein